MVGSAQRAERVRTYLLPRSGAGAASKVQPRGKRMRGAWSARIQMCIRAAWQDQGPSYFERGISRSRCRIALFTGSAIEDAGGVRDGECVVVTSPRASASLPRKTYRAHLVIRSWAELASNLAVGTDNALSRMESPAPRRNSRSAQPPMISISDPARRRQRP